MDLFNSAIQYVLNHDIPRRILEDNFLPSKHSTERNRSLNDCLIEQVIRNKVMPDLNSIGGTLIDVPLYECPFTYDDSLNYRYHRIYSIDPKYTQNRSIFSVLRAYNNGIISATAGMTPFNAGYSSYQTSTTDEMISKQIMSRDRVIPFTDTDIEIVGPHTLRVVNTIMLAYNLTLECRVAYSSEFHELLPPYHLEFKKLVNLATKACIYRDLRLEMDMFKLDGGRELGTYKDYVDNYSNAAEDYQQQLDTRWRKLLLLGDARRAKKADWNSGMVTV